MSIPFLVARTYQTAVIAAVFLLAPACGTESSRRPPHEADDGQQDPDDEDRPAPDPEPDPEPDSIVAKGAFASPEDRARFENDVLPSARAFLAYWAEAGLTVAHGQARIFVSPPPETKAVQGLPALYGEKIFDEMSALEVATAKAATNEAALDLIDAFTCEHPPLYRGMLDELEEELANPMLTPAVISRALKEERTELSAPSATFSFHQDNGEFELPLRRNCSYILVGHATDSTREHPFLEKDVINHELGHALHYGAWLASGLPLGEALSSSANEAIADMLAHVFDGDPCHGKVLDESHQAVDCRRRMNGYEQSVSDAVWSWGRGDHDTGQSLRDLIWTLRAQEPVDDLKAAIVAGIKAIQPPLNVIDAEPLATAPVFDDEILAVRYRFMREYEACDAFFGAVCARVGEGHAVCGEHEARIGDPRTEMRKSWLANSPTVIGENGIALEDGRYVSFEVDGPYLNAMIVTEVDGTSKRYETTSSLDHDEQGVTLWFGEPAELGWTSDAKLVKPSVFDPCEHYDEQTCGELPTICKPSYTNSCECTCADDAPGCSECPAACFTFAACVQQG